MGYRLRCMLRCLHNKHSHSQVVEDPSVEDPSAGRRATKQHDEAPCVHLPRTKGFSIDFSIGFSIPFLAAVQGPRHIRAFVGARRHLRGAAAGRPAGGAALHRGWRRSARCGLLAPGAIGAARAIEYSQRGFAANGCRRGTTWPALAWQHFALNCVSNARHAPVMAPLRASPITPRMAPLMAARAAVRCRAPQNVPPWGRLAEEQWF